ncbi:flagellar hook-length control protein FliK [Lacipirellula parvula]|uniref:Flagellar hook-length control protein-like C-terminal domain-containing protein n=1 Tax=Lacipirellula parvula TaxID=2650471 RepID=A0A5K7XM08_9BACT|nr:flagellar hook-length control protein FliK [Lacipirellula parvula]BBO34009.1 hypothetical protein PLANPX_3621 [Lacipirellula parvula]
MPFSPIDAIMPKAAPKRTADAAPRTENGSPFQPALEHAYKDKAEAPQKPAAPAPAERKPAEKSPTTGEKRESKQPADQAAANSQPASDASEAAEVAVEETTDDEDAAEISAEAAAAMLALQEAPAAEPVTTPIAVEGEKVEQVVAVAAPQAPATEKTGGSPGEEGDAEAGEQAASAEIEFAILDNAQTEPSQQESSTAQVVATAEVKPTAVENPEQPVVLVAEDAPATTAEQPGGEKLVAVEQAESPQEERSDDDASEEEAESADQSVTAEAKVEAVAEETAAAASANAASDSEASASDAANAPAPTSDVAAAGADSASRSTKAIDRLLGSRSLKAANESNDSNGMPSVDRARFVQRVEGAMKAAHQRDGKIHVRLSPPELGSVKIELAMQNGVLSAKLEAETPAARNILLDSLPALRDQLAQQDIRIEKFDVDVRQEGGNAGSNQTDDRTADQSGERQQNRPRPAGNSRVPATPVVARALSTGSSAAAGLDVRV